MKAFLTDGRIEIDINPAKNEIRSNVICRKIGFSPSMKQVLRRERNLFGLAEIAKANGIDFYQYVVKLLTEL